jgi:hypothetical protein
MLINNVPELDPTSTIFRRQNAARKRAVQTSISKVKLRRTKERSSWWRTINQKSVVKPHINWAQHKDLLQDAEIKSLKKSIHREMTQKCSTKVTKLEKPAVYMRVKAPALPATWIPLTCGRFWTQSCRASGHG